MEEYFIVKPKEQELWKPENKFEFGMYLDGNFYALFYKHQNKNLKIVASIDNRKIKVVTFYFIKEWQIPKI